MRGLRVLLLGRPRLELDGQALTGLMPVKQQALVFVLAAEGQAVGRARAAALLWGAHDEAAARANLRVALSQLRRWLPGLLAIDAREIAFAPDAPVAVDLAELEAALARPDADPGQRVAAAQAWRGPLLDGFELADGDEFERWLQPQRQRAAAAATRLHAELSARAAAAGDLERAIAHARARLRVDDADEPAHMDLMAWLAARGQRTAALAQYEICRVALRERLGARPSAACYASYARIHADAPAPAGAADAQAPAAGASGADAPQARRAVAARMRPAGGEESAAADGGEAGDAAVAAAGDDDGSADDARDAAGSAPFSPAVAGPLDGTVATAGPPAVVPSAVPDWPLASSSHRARPGPDARLDAPAHPSDGPDDGHGPRAVPAIVGREAELTLLTECLTDPEARWLTLLGPGGVGKTTLALAVAHALRPHFRHGTLWLSGRDDGGVLRDADAVLRRVIARCGDDRAAPGALLLVLDNLETVPPAAARALADELEQRATGVAVLATSRQRLAHGREWLVELTGLPLARTSPAAEASSPAARLFIAAARRAAPGFEPGAEGAAIERLAARLGGLPLALELAGRAAQRLGVAALAAQAEAGDDAGLDIVFADSWARLDPPLREAARRLAWLPVEADEALAHVVGVGSAALQALRDHAWLQRGERGRLTPHPLQQDFLRRRQDEDGRSVGESLADEVRRRLAEALAERLPAVPPLGLGPPPAPALRAAQQALADTALGSDGVLTVAAAHWLQHDPAPTLRARLDAAVSLLVTAGRLPEAVALLGQALRRPDLPAALAAAWRLQQGELRVAQGEPPGTLETLLLPLAQLGLGGMRAGDGSLPAAALQAATARSWSPDPAERRAIARLAHRCLMLLGQLLSFSPHPRGIERACLLGLLVAGPARESRRSVQVLLGYGALFNGAGAVSRLIAPAPARRPRFAQSAAMDAHSAQGVIATAMALGRWQGLDAELQAHAEDNAAIGQRRCEMEARSLRAKLAFYEGRLVDAERLFADCEARAQTHPGAAWMAWGGMGLAECGWARGSLDDAALASLVERVSRTMTESENADNAYTLRRLGLVARLAWRRGDAAAGREAVGAALASLAHVPRRGFWAHEGYAGIGEGLLAWIAHERRVGGALPPLQRHWAAFETSLRAHGRRFPAGAALTLRLRALAAADAGDTRAADAGLRRGVAAAERQGLRVELARCCDALAALHASTEWDDRARRLWRDMGRLA